MPPEMFDELLNRVGPKCQGPDTPCRKALDPGMKFAITLRHLASGDKYPSLQCALRVPRNTISLFISEVCRAIVDEYKDKVISCPASQVEWRTIAEEFQT